MSSAYLRLLIFLPAVLIPACASSSPYLQSVPLSESLEDIQYSDPGFHTTLHQTVLVCSGHKVMGFTGAITHTELLRICWPTKQWNSFLKICLRHQLADDTQMVRISIFHDSVYNLTNDNFMMLCTEKLEYVGLETKGRSRNGLFETSVPVIHRNLSPQLCKPWGACSQKRNLSPGYTIRVPLNFKL